MGDPSDHVTPLQELVHGAEREEVLEAFFRHTQTGLVLLDRDFNFVRVNEAYARACHREASDFVGRNHFELYPSSMIEDFKRVVATKQPWSISARPFVFPDHPEWGTTYWDLACVPILDAKGEVAHLVFSLHDVTPIIRAEVALRDSEARLRQAQKMEALGRLAGGVAHDFNNLLCVINSYSSLALADATGQMAADLAQVVAAGERAAVLTRQLLAFSRQQVLEPTVVSLNEIVGRMEPMLRRLIGEHVELRVRLAPDLGAVLVDPGQVELAVMNLVVNARDAMPRGGRLDVETMNVDVSGGVNGESGLPAGAYVRLVVADTGSGIEPTTRAKIFEPFFTTKPAGKGTGLGLASVLGIVQQSGGTVTVQSEQGAGSRFELTFPRRATLLEPARPAPHPTAKSTGHETLLVVEDADPVRAVFVRVLRDAGYHVLSAATGEEALAVAAAYAGPIQLVVTDVIMPQMGGPELLERLRAVRSSFKTLFVSGYANDAAALQTKLDEDTQFIAKPVTPDALLQKVRGVLDG